MAERFSDSGEAAGVGASEGSGAVGPVDGDARFPSGRWEGYWTEPARPGRQWMALTLAFAEGRVQGSGQDPVGAFSIEGSCCVTDGTCLLHKRYDGGGIHVVLYHGRCVSGDAAGIAGLWWLQGNSGRFCLWPAIAGRP